MTSGFSYNPAHQISARTLSNDDYVYDAHSALDQDADYNGLNQMTDVLGGAFSLSYDTDGNVTDDVGYTYDYDPAGRLETASNGLNLDYDPFGRLSDEDGPTRQRDHQYDGWDRIASYTNAGALSERYVFGPGVDEPLVQYTGLDTGSPSREWLHADERGSIVAHSDDAGARSALMIYDEFGMPGAAYPHIWQTTGQASLDHPRLHHYKTRAFNNQLIAFMQPDTIGLAGGPNLYAYLGGDGVNNRDPWGMSEEDDEEPEVIVVIGRHFYRQSWQTFIWSFMSREHSVLFVEQICSDASDISDADVNEITRMGTAPTAGPLEAVEDGSKNMVTSPEVTFPELPGLLGILGGVPVPGGFVVARFDGPVGRNVTIEGAHMLHDGTVDRVFFRDSRGGLSVMTRGQGTHDLAPWWAGGPIVNGALAATNQATNPVIFMELNDRLSAQLNAPGGLCAGG